MEESRKTRRISKSYRLLICCILLFLFITLSLFAHRYSYVVFKPVEEYIFAGEDSAFEATINNIRPADVLVTVQTLPENVTFVSSEKTEILDENGRSTRIRVVFRFDEVGNFKLPPIASRIRYGSYKLSITPVTVLYNPQTIQPIVRFSVLEPSDKQYYEGQRIKLQLTAIFASNIYSFTTSLKEDSVFYPKGNLAILPLQIEKFSDAEYPIEIFEMIPLTNGKIEVPPVSVKVKTWNGIEKNTISEPLILNVKKSVVKNEVDAAKTQETVTLQNDSSLENNSVPSISKNNPELQNVIQGIKNLRLIERKKIFPISIIKERRQLELQCELQNTENEFSVSLFYVLLAITIIFIILFIIFAILKKKTKMIIFMIIAVTLLILVGIYKIQLNKDFALILQGEVLSIPEETSSLNISLNSGFRVEVKGETKDWIFIKYGNSTGWIKRENLLFL